jgi:hypothetical protein
MNSTPFAKPDPFDLVCFLRGLLLHMFLIFSTIIQMFQTPALIVMSIAATWMHRSLTDYADFGYSASCLPCAHLMLTATIAQLSGVRYLPDSEGVHGEN